MHTYVTFLRGINVSGKNIIKMTDLKALFENLNFQKVSTYIQSGNIVFVSLHTDTEKIKEMIQFNIQKKFELDIPIILLTKNQLEHIITQNIFSTTKDSSFLHVTFIPPTIHSIDYTSIQNKKSIEEEIHFTKDAIYLYCPNGYGNTKLTNSFLEKKLRVSTTTRNWNTVKKLLTMTEHLA